MYQFKFISRSLCRRCFCSFLVATPGSLFLTPTFRRFGLLTIQFLLALLLNFLLALALLTVAYVGIGSGLRHRAGSRGAEMLPHRAEWRQLGGLVRDGVEFSRARLRGKGRASREPLRQQKSPTKKRRQHKDRRREEPDRPEPPEPSRQQPDVAAVAEAEVQAPSGTAAGDGGRWVRLPG